MLFRNWLKHMRSGEPRPRRRGRLVVEPLETRVVPAAVITGLTPGTDTGPSNSDGYTSDTTPSLVGTANANAIVEVFNGTTSLGTTTADSSGDWTFDVPVGTPLTEGVHSITALDDGGVSDPFSVTIDTTPPALGTPTVTGGAVTNDTTPTFNGTAGAATGDGATVSVKVYSGTTATGTPVQTLTANIVAGAWTIDATALGDGTYTLQAEQADNAGNVGLSSAVTFEVDATDPTVTLTGPTPGGSTNDTTPTFSGTAGEDDGDADTVTVEIYSGSTVSGTPIQTLTANVVAGAWTIDAGTLTPGTYTARATQADDADNLGVSAPLTFTVDTTAPSAPSGLTLALASDSGTTGDNRTNDTTPTLTGTAEANAVIEVFDDTTSLGTTTADGSGNWSFTPAAALGEGAHTFTATAEDAAGNTSGLSSVLTVTLDLTPPAAPTGLTLDPASDTGTQGDNITEDATPTITGTAAANSIVEVFDGTTSLGTTTANGTGAWSFTVSTPLSTGTHSLTATATDDAGNESVASSALGLQIVDLTAPNPPANLGLAAGSDSGTDGDGITNNTTPAITGTAEANATIEVFDGTTSLGTTTADGSGNWSFTPSTALSEGSHSITATATDASSNESAPSSVFTLVIDVTAPDAPEDLTLDPASDTAPTGDGITEDSTPTITGTAEANATIEVFDGTTSLGTTTANASGNWSFTPVIPLTNASHTLTATATDAAGNESAVSTGLTIQIADVTPPDAPEDLALDPASDGGADGDGLTNDNTPTITGTAEPGSTIEVFDGTTSLGTTTTAANGTWSFTPATALVDGAHSLTAKATDPANNTSPASSAFLVTIDTDAPDTPAAPTVDPASDGGTDGDGLTNDTTPTLTGTAEANSTVTILDGTTVLGTATANGSGVWTFTPSTALSEGSHSITVTATDAAGNVSAASAALALTIDSTLAAPSGLTLDPASDSGTTGDNRTNDTTPTITGTAEANAIVEIFDGTTSLGTTTANASGQWTFTPATALTEGAHTLTAVATDTAGNVSAASTALVVTVDATAPTTPAAPTLTTGSDTGTVGDNITSDTTPTITGTAEANAIVEIFDGTTSLGTTTADGSGNWTFTPSTALVGGAHTLTVTARDAAGNTSTASSGLTLTIDVTAPAVPGTPDLVAGADTGLLDTDNITSRTTPTFTGTAEPGSTIRVFAGAALLGTTVADASGTWLFTSPPLADGPYTIAVTATDAAGNVTTISAGLPILIDSSGRIANPLNDVSNRVGVTMSRPRRVNPPRRRPARRRTRPRPPWMFRQTVTITNTSGRNLEGPLSFALDGLNSRTSLMGGAQGRSPFVEVMPSNGVLAAGQSLTFVLTFNNPLQRPIRFTPRVMSGFGTL